MGISVMKFMDLWEKFEQTGDINDYLEYCANYKCCLAEDSTEYQYSDKQM